MLLQQIPLNSRGLTPYQGHTEVKPDLWHSRTGSEPCLTHKLAKGNPVRSAVTMLRLRDGKPGFDIQPLPKEARALITLLPHVDYLLEMPLFKHFSPSLAYILEVK